MFKSGSDAHVSEAAARRAQEQAVANNAHQKQAKAELSSQTMFVDMDTGEITYAKLHSETNQAAEATATALVEPERPSPVQSTDPDTAYRRARLGFVAVIVLVLFWLWVRQRRAA